MGIGDEIMASGEVMKLVRANPSLRVAIRSKTKTPWHRWHVIWKGNPHIAPPGTPYDTILDNAPGNRPYIAAKTERYWIWKEYAPEPGLLVLSEEEMAYAQEARGRIIVQPFIKANSSPNKKWPLEYWQRLIDLTPHLNWAQVGDGLEPRLAGVKFIQTPSFREACGVLAGARALVANEGGLHHAAAALGTPAVVIFGGFISPRVTGYASQRNIFVEDPKHPLGCGARVPCSHCFQVMTSIKPEQVLTHLEELLA